jgi:hypothetical protein
MSENTFWDCLQPLLQQRHGAIYYDPDHRVVLLKARASYLPYEHFLHFCK